MLVPLSGGEAARPAPAGKAQLEMYFPRWQYGRMARGDQAVCGAVQAGQRPGRPTGQVTKGSGLVQRSGDGMPHRLAVEIAVKRQHAGAVAGNALSPAGLLEIAVAETPGENRRGAAFNHDLQKSAAGVGDGSVPQSGIRRAAAVVHVMLGDEHFQTHCPHAGEECTELRRVDRSAEGAQMPLKSETFDGYAPRQRPIEKIERGGAEGVVLRTSQFAAPIVVHEKGTRIRRLGRMKGEVDIAHPQRFQPETSPQRVGSSVRGRYGFIDHIPGMYVPTKMPHHLFDIRDDQRLVARRSDRLLEPVRVALVPDKRMPPEIHAACARKSEYPIAGRKVERTAYGFHDAALHFVFRNKDGGFAGEHLREVVVCELVCTDGGAVKPAVTRGDGSQPRRIVFLNGGAQLRRARRRAQARYGAGALQKTSPREHDRQGTPARAW